jgi:HK97 family phage major capsid protein
MSQLAESVVCPYCSATVERFEGECPKCKGDLNVPGFRNSLDEIAERTKGVHDMIHQQGEKLDDTEARLAKLEDLNQQRVDNDTDPEGRVPQVDIVKLIRGLAMKDEPDEVRWKDAELEKRIMNESGEVARTMGMGAIGTGGALVPTQYLAEQFIEALHARSVTEQLGATVLDGLRGSPVEIARMASDITAEWVDENDEKPEHDLTFEKLSLTPHEVASFARVSNRLVMLGNPSIATLLNNDMTRAIAGALDIAALRGTGAGAQPIGITNTPGINVHVITGDTGNGATPAIDDLYDMLYELEVDDADMGRMGWALHPRTFNTLRKQRSDSGAGPGTGNYLLQPDVTAPFKGTMIGFPFRMTTRIPINLSKGTSTNCSELLFGNWEDLLIARWGTLEVRTSQEAGTAFRYNQTWIRASLLADVGVRHAESFCLADGVRP